MERRGERESERERVGGEERERGRGRGRERERVRESERGKEGVSEERKESTILFIIFIIVLLFSILANYSTQDGTCFTPIRLVKQVKLLTKPI